MLMPALLRAASARPVAAPPASPLWERISSSPLAWIAAAVLLLVGLVYLIRLLEWDLVNARAENQDDPLIPRE